jgi:hypothetical protein
MASSLVETRRNTLIKIKISIRLTIPWFATHLQNIGNSPFIRWEKGGIPGAKKRTHNSHTCAAEIRLHRD